MFCHSPDSWTRLWDGQVFEKGTVTVDVQIVDRTHKRLKDGALVDVTNLYLDWIVTRV